VNGKPECSSRIRDASPREVRSDSTDKAVGVRDLFFPNLEDFTQRWFANGVQGTPSPYGPVLFEFEPAATAHLISVDCALSKPHISVAIGTDTQNKR
jgi:hypothetical protein